MSEYLQNNRERQEKLKDIVRQLHEGSDVGSVRKEFHDLIRNVSPEEIAEMEQALIAGGIPAQQVQKLCDVHVQVFEQSLSRRKKEKYLPGHPVHTYREENREAKRILRSLRKLAGRAARGRDRQEFERTFERFREIEKHYQRKENQLFPYLEQVGFTGPSKVMWGKHDEIRSSIRAVEAAYRDDDPSRLSGAVKDLVGAVRRMIFMEEKILFPTAMRKLPERAWIEMRRGEPDIGYAWVKPGSLWDPDIAAARAMADTLANAAAAASGPKAGTEAGTPAGHAGGPAAGSAEAGGSPGAGAAVDLDVGSLSPQQINLLLRNLSVDVTFVDENDEVRYYSHGRERVFPRSPGIIGRKVQNCHPPDSVHMVERILEGFRNREHDEAEFWIEMKGKFIHIRYYPIYDDAGVYRGVIEVTQDATHLRALQGQKRLLDWEA